VREALLFLCHILNRVSYKNYEKTFKIWGCLTKVAVLLTKRRKLWPKIIDCVFIEYAQHSVAYMFFVIKFEMNEINANTIIESRNVTFF